MNLLNAFFNPRKAVQESLEEPNLVTIAGLNIVHVIVFSLVMLFLGISFNLSIVVLALINSFVLTLFFSGIL
ncbi:MAG: hypothetical protein Q7K42_01715, partial [Candidatus Diapherotrites archaeon]|nr:hypothetical protein [Candidatus Diapherotrites archaeon]